jgi:hypothetical protein
MSSQACLPDGTGWGECDCDAGSGGSGGVGGVGGANAGGSGNVSYEGQGTFTEDYDYAFVTRNGQEYVVQNYVWWGGRSQTLEYEGTSFVITQAAGTDSTDGSPVAYPSVFIGSNNSRTTAASGLPIQVGSISSIPTGWTWASNGASGDWAAAYELWFSSVSDGENDHALLLVSLSQPPSSAALGSEVGSATIDSVSYAVWSGTSNNIPTITYVRSEPATSVSFDLGPIVQDAAGDGLLSSTAYLTNIFAGFQIWSGGQGLETVDVYVSVD